MGDGCAMEGISHEAASLAAHWKLNKLTLIYDDNKNTIDGSTDLTFSEDISLRFKALGWNVVTVDATHGNMRSFENALMSACNETRRPTFIRVGCLMFFIMAFIDYYLVLLLLLFPSKIVLLILLGHVYILVVNFRLRQK